MDRPSPALRPPAGVARATPLPTEVLTPLAPDAAAALPNAPAPVSVVTLPRLAPPPMASVEPASAGTALRHRAVDVAVKAKPRHRGLLQPHAPQRPRIEPRRAAGIRDRGAEAKSGPDKRAAAGNRPEARFEPGRGQARCDNARHVLDRLIGRHGAVAGDRRRAALPRDRLRARCRSSNADARPRRRR